MNDNNIILKKYYLEMKSYVLGNDNTDHLLLLTLNAILLNMNYYVIVMMKFMLVNKNVHV